MDYEAYWGLSAPPFDIRPDPKLYFPSFRHEEALHRLLYGIEGKRGAALLTGEPGSGKTLVGRELLGRLDRDMYEPILVSGPPGNAARFLTAVLGQLGIEASGSRLDLLQLLTNYLMANHHKGLESVLIVDDAHAFGDPEVFEDLHRLQEVQCDGQYIVSVVLLGQPPVHERIAAVRSFGQRVTVRYHLGVLSSSDTEAYIRFRLEAVGAQRDPFAPDAVRRIHEVTRGVPGTVSRLADVCLLLAYVEEADSIDVSIVERAAVDLA